MNKKKTQQKVQSAKKKSQYTAQLKIQHPNKTKHKHKKNKK
jgi:hypothetical protein